MTCTEEEWKELKAKELQGKVDYLFKKLNEIELKIEDMQMWKIGQIQINRSLKSDIVLLSEIFTPSDKFNLFKIAEHTGFRDWNESMKKKQKGGKKHEKKKD